MVYFYLQFVPVPGLPMERRKASSMLCVWAASSFLSKKTITGSLPLGMVRYLHPNLTEIFDPDCSHSGFDNTAFISRDIRTGLFALP